MKEVNYQEYNKDFENFVNKNKKYDLEIKTSSFENNGYHKEYNYSNGATFYESNKTIVEEIEITNHNIKSIVKVKYFVTEYWSTIDSVSKYVYQSM